MSTKQDIELHEGEDWKITFAAHYADLTTMPLVSGDEVLFRISNSNGDVMLDCSVGFGVTVTDEAGGLADIEVPANDQSHNGISSLGSYFYEIKVIKGDRSYDQAEGRLKVSHSLFASEINPLAMEFHLRFPEFTDDDGLISLYINDATSVVDDSGAKFSESDRTLAILYIAAHLLQLRYWAKLQYESGATQTGPVRMIRVEDRTVSYGDPTASFTKTGAGQTYYGQQYLSLLRKYPVWLMRA